MANLELSYTPIHETTARFHGSNAFARWLRGPLASGKSFAIVWEILRRAAEQPVSRFGTRRSKVIFVRNTRQMLKDTVLPIFQEVIPEGVIGNWRESDSVYQIRIGDVECDVLFRPLEDEKDIRRVLSINATFCVIDEWREIPVAIINDIAGRAGRFPPKEAEGCAFVGIFGASNSPNEDSGWYKKLEVERPPGWEVFAYPSARSQEATWRAFLDDGYYERLMEGATPDYIRVMIDNEYGRSLAGTAVYEKTFNDDFHVAKEPLAYVRDSNYPLTLAFDFGRTPACVVCQRDHRGRVLILSEVYQENIGLERFLQDHVKPHLAQKYPGMTLRATGDPAGWAKSQINELSCGDILQQNGLPARKAVTNDPAMRIEAVERLLARQIDGQAYLIIDPGCKKLIRGFRGGYKYKRKSDGTTEAAPSKDEYSHIHDALQYACCMLDSLGGGYASRQAMPVARAKYRYV